MTQFLSTQKQNIRFTIMFRLIVAASIINIAHCSNAQEKSDVRTFVNNYCIDCHGNRETNANVSFAKADFMFAKPASVYFWQDALDVLNSGAMPPDDEKQPSNDELKKAIGEITDRLQSARKRLEATGGIISMRHLSQREYAGSIKDLFGVEVPTAELPPNATSGFDTNGRDQFFTSNHYESYLTVAQKTVRNAIRNCQEPFNPQTSRHDPEDYFNELKTRQLKELKEKMTLLKSGASYQEAGFGDQTQADVFKRHYKRNLARLNEYFARPYIKVGSGYKVNYSQTVRPASLYKIAVQLQSPRETYMPVSVNGEHLDSLNLEALKGRDQTHEFTFTTDLLTAKLEIALRPPGGGYVDNIKVTGPYPLAESFFHKTFERLINKSGATEGEVADALRKFADRAFRYQQVDKEFIRKLVAIYKQDRAAGLDLVESIRDPIAAILASPDFLYIKEKNDGKRRSLTQHEFAIRLACFLWSSPPDDALYQKVRNENLFDQKVLEAEVVRMLSSDRADVFLAGFINQWSDIQRFDEIDLPGQYLGRFQDSARRELSEFFKVIARENLPVDNLIDSDFVVIDSTLASHYKIKGQFTGFEKAELPKNSPRGGMLSQAAFLIMGTSGGRTSPTIRGTIIREALLHDPPPPPPPNVPQIEANEANPTSVREQLQRHREVPQCASCHEKIDPIGFGLENFDYLGRWRSMEVLGKVDEDPRKRRKMQKAPPKVEIDPSGFLSMTEKFDDFEGLKQVLLNRRDRLALSIYEGLLSYGVGRDVEFVDEDEVKAALDELEKTEYRVRDIITAVVTSATFRTK